MITEGQFESKESDIDLEVYTSIEEIQAVAEEWHSFLQQEAGKRRLRQDPVSLISRLERSPKEQPVVVFVRRGGRVQCIAVCVIYEQRLKLHLSVFKVPTAKVRVLKVLDSEFVYSKSTDEIECVASMFAALEKLPQLFDMIYLEDLRIGGPLHSYFEQERHAAADIFKLVTTSVTAQKIHKHILGDTYDNWLMTVSKKSRKRIRQAYRQLAAAHDDDIQLERVTELEAIAEYQKNLNDIYPKTWQAKVLGPPQRNTEKDNAVFVQAAENGWLRVYLLRVKGDVVAFDIGYQYGDTYLASEGGYDPDYAKWSVGAVLLQLILQDLYVFKRPKQYSLGFGDNEYKWAISNDVQDATQAYVTKRGLSRRLIGLQLFLNNLEKATRRFLDKIGLLELARRIVKRK